MATLKHNCPKCKKPAKIQAELTLGNNLYNYVYQCGHVELRVKLVLEEEPKPIEDYTKVEVPEETFEEQYEVLDRWVVDGGLIKGTDLQRNWINPKFFSTDGRFCAYEFQRDGVAFAEKTNLRCLIADSMGLGKTIQAIITLKKNKKFAIPALILVKGTTLFQWAAELTKWYSAEFGKVIAVTSRIHLIPGFEIYVLSIDMMSKKDVREKLSTLGIKCVVVDECQNIKDQGAQRTKGVTEFLLTQNITQIIALSGTPFKNRATEYFTILNILAPIYFWSLAEFKQRWCLPETKMNAKGNAVTTYQRLIPEKADEFLDFISRWVIRREKHDVLKNLPSLTRDFQLIELDDQNVKNSYNHALDLFANWLNDNKSGASSAALLGWLQQLRGITGQAKCKHALEWINDFLESTDEQLAVGIHHHSVRDTLRIVMKQNGLEPLTLSGEDSLYAKNDIVRRFTRGDNRVLVLNSIAGGVGLNLQNCANALVLERQWNSSDEEQFESRFHRDGQQKAVTITYLIAKGTIDEFFHDMVVKKKKIQVEAGIGSELDITSDVNSLKELAELVISHRL